MVSLLGPALVWHIFLCSFPLSHQGQGRVRPEHVGGNYPELEPKLRISCLNVMANL